MLLIILPESSYRDGQQVEGSPIPKVEHCMLFGSGVKNALRRELVREPPDTRYLRRCERGASQMPGSSSATSILTAMA